MTNALVKGFRAFARKVRFRMNREHRNLVGNLPEALAHGTPDAKRRRRRALQFRKARLERREFIPGAVVLSVGHARRIKDVVLVAPAFDFRLELRHALSRFFGRHGGSRGLRAEGVRVGGKRFNRGRRRRFCCCRGLLRRRKRRLFGLVKKRGHG